MLLLHSMKADLSFITIYTCAKCKCESAGTTVSTTVQCFSGDGLKNAVDNHRQTSTHMPYEWSYNGEFHCQKCRQK